VYIVKEEVCTVVLGTLNSLDKRHFQLDLKKKKTIRAVLVEGVMSWNVSLKF